MAKQIVWSEGKTACDDVKHIGKMNGHVMFELRMNCGTGHHHVEGFWHETDGWMPSMDRPKSPLLLGYERWDEELSLEAVKLKCQEAFDQFVESLK